MKPLVLIAALALAGCASSVVSSNSRGGIIKAGFKPNGFTEAFKVADAECAKAGRVAVVQSKNLLDNTMRYTCEER